jgi:hypothetical protein
LGAEQVRQLFGLLDWMLQLPEGLDRQFRQEVERLLGRPGGGTSGSAAISCCG